MVHNYRELKVWQRALSFTVWIYKETGSLPDNERFGLTSQRRRASCSIPMNIAEGSGNSSPKEFCRFLEIALRSDYEVMTAIEIARRLQYWSDTVGDALLKEGDEIAAMIVGLIKTLGGR